MGMFKNILEKLGIKKSEKEIEETRKGPMEAPRQQTVSKPASKPKAPAKPVRPSAVPSRKGSMRAGKPAEVPMVDVVSKLEGMAAMNPQKLNWKTSIVDLLKLLDIDSSLEARKELALELGCPGELMSDSAKMNTWLHKTVLQEIAKNGGNIPAELLD
jgi:hypothetical protein